MATIITPEFRGAYPALFKPRASSAFPDNPQFSILMCFPPEADIGALKGLIETAVKEKFGSNVPKVLRLPLGKNGDRDTPINGIPDDWWVAKATAKPDYPPGVVDSQAQPILNAADVYGGAWFRAQISAYAYSRPGNNGVSLGLRNVQKVKDDDSLGGSSAPATKVFSPIAGDGKKPSSASSLFD